jgi:hypothetical protein
MNEHDECEAWKDQVYEALRDDAPEFAGEASSGQEGDFKNVGFHIAAAYGEAGERGGMIVGITVTDQESPSKGKHTQVEGNWRNDDPEVVAEDTVAAYINLVGQS